MAQSKAQIAAEARFFSSTPWCAALLNEPRITTFLPSSRIPDPPTDGSASQDTFFRHTLGADSAVPHCLGFYEDPATIASSTSEGIGFILSSLSLLLDLQPGLNGFNGTVHAGCTGSLLDEVMGSLIFWNHMLYQREVARGRVPSNVLDVGKARVFTAGMNIRLQRPIPTPSIVVATASLDRVEGKKIYLGVRLWGEKGVEYAKCEGLWIMASGGKL